MITANLRSIEQKADNSILTPEFLAELPKTQMNLDNIVSSIRVKKRVKKIDEKTGRLF